VKRVRFSFAGKLMACLCGCALLCVSTAAKEKEKQKEGTKIVDSGSFGVFRSGTRVATETFSIKQDAAGSVISSEFKSSQGEQVAEQTSELQLAPSGEIRHYEWKETAPEKAQVTVEPNDTFLVERFSGSSDNKTRDQNFLLPASTMILDDYFFVQREVLAWKYLASACKKENGPLSCPLHQKVSFGALNPHARESFSVGVEFSGREKLTLHGAEHEYSRFVISSEAGNWAFWLDDQLKIVRLLNEAGTEIIRD
jgi:hypothetical protein